MKKILTLASVLLSFVLAARADETTVKLSHVHLCCNSCVKGVDKAISGVPHASAQCEKEDGTVTITAPDKATAQKAVNALVGAGYFGVSSDPSIKVAAHSGAKSGKVQS